MINRLPLLFLLMLFACMSKQEARQKPAKQNKQKKKVASPYIPSSASAKSDTTLAFLEGEWEAGSAHCNECAEHVVEVDLRLSIKQGIASLAEDDAPPKMHIFEYDGKKKRFISKDSHTIVVNDRDAITYNTDSNHDGSRYFFTRVKK